jgi:hypothetical protein
LSEFTIHLAKIVFVNVLGTKLPFFGVLQKILSF